MRFIVLAAVCAALLSGCSKYDEYRYRKEATAWMKDRMNDPESAEFWGMRVLWRQDKEIILCGEVNAKNRMGGYVGYRPFYVLATITDGRRDISDADVAPADPRSPGDDIDEMVAFMKSYIGNCGTVASK